MRVVLHHGMSKAGSTALQKGLAARRRALRERGVLYPKAPVIPHSHNFLMAGILPRAEWPRFVRHAMGRAGARASRVERWLGDLGEACARTGTETLVLSSENLWALRDPAPAARLREMILGIGATRIETVAYLRRPSDWYLSMVQQVLAASHALRPVGPIPYRAPIEAVAGEVADPGAARLYAYDRDAFPRGDVLAHFLETCLGLPPEPEGGPAREANATLSAEGMDLLRGYRLHVHPDGNGSFTQDTRRLRGALDRADLAVPGRTRPALREALRERIDQGSPDLAWLREVHGVTFEGIDYDRLREGRWSKRPERVDDICPVDPLRLERLTAAVLRELVEGEAG